MRGSPSAGGTVFRVVARWAAVAFQSDRRGMAGSSSKCRRSGTATRLTRSERERYMSPTVAPGWKWVLFTSVGLTRQVNVLSLADRLSAAGIPGRPALRVRVACSHLWALGGVLRDAAAATSWSSRAFPAPAQSTRSVRHPPRVVRRRKGVVHDPQQPRLCIVSITRLLCSPSRRRATYRATPPSTNLPGPATTT